MATEGFGRKGVGVDASAPRRARLVASDQPRSFQPIQHHEDPDFAAFRRRTAFLASEQVRADKTSDAVPLPSAEAEAAASRLKQIELPPPTDRSLRHAFAIWFLLGLGGGHRFYLRRPRTGAVQALLFLGCLGAVAGFQYYQGFAGLALSWLWYLADGIRLKQLHLWSGPE